MSKNFETLAALAKDLPVSHKANALALVEQMGLVIEGLSDKPMEWKPATLKLVQATTDRSKLPKGATIGSVILGENIVVTPLKIIPLRVYTTRQLWHSDPAAATMICSSPDAMTGFRYGSCKVCPNSKFDEIEKRSACNKSLTIVSVTEDLSSIFITNFSKTNYANGLDWQMLMKKAGVSPYKRIYEISSGTSPKVKNVEILKVEPVTGQNVVSDKILPFVEELFRLSGEDRVTSLANFYDYIENKKDMSQLQITGSEASDTVTLITAAEHVASVSSVGGYKL
jgi:hypothetical protein